MSLPLDLTIQSGLSPKEILKGRYTKDTENVWVRIFVTKFKRNVPQEGMEW